jgi:O-antigen ligase
VVGLGLVTGASYHTTKRTISVSQLFTNAQSVVGSGSGGAQLQGSVNFRTTLWVNVLHAETSSGHFIYGFGFGPNLAQIGGLSQRETNSAAAEQLRSAHNSLLDVLARMGIVGAATFVVFWVGWFVRMIRARRKSKDDDDTRGVIGMCVCFTLATFINCFFDPTLEGAQVAAVLYTLCGLGIICARTPINGIVSPTPRLRPAVPVLGPKLGPSLGL